MSVDALSPWRGRDRRPLRIALAAVAVYDLLFLLHLASRADARLDAVAGPWPYDALVHAPAVLAALLGLGLAAAVRFAVSGGVGSLLVLLAALHLGEECGGRAFATLPPEPFLPGVMLFGWLVGLLWTRARDERLAELAAVAACGASYGLAGFAKLARSGLGWDHRVIWHVTLSGSDVERIADSALIEALLATPALGDALAYGAIAIQLFALALPFGARLRQLAAGLLVAMHASMFALGGLLDLELLVLLTCFGRLWAPQLRAPHDDAAPTPAATLPAPARRVAPPAWLVVGLVALPLFAIFGPVRDWIAYEPVMPRTPFGP